MLHQLALEKRPSDSKTMAYLSPVLAILLTLISGGLLFASLGKDPLEALHVFFIAPLTDLYGWTELFTKVAPLLLCAMGLTLCFKAKIWNIGAEGQFILGGLGGGYLALELMNVESGMVLPAVLFFGALCGLLWASLAALLKTRFGANEILTTIMLNYIALNWLLYGVHGPLKDPEGFNFPESAMFSEFATLPLVFEDYRLNISIYFALFAVAVIWALMSKTLVGFQIAVMGEDHAAARFAGFKEKRLTWFALPRLWRLSWPSRCLRSSRSGWSVNTLHLTGIRLHRHHCSVPGKNASSRYFISLNAPGFNLYGRRNGANGFSFT